MAIIALLVIKVQVLIYMTLLFYSVSKGLRNNSSSLVPIVDKTANYT